MPTPDPADAPRATLYVGLAKTGTTFIQKTLAAHRDKLETHGFQYPYLGPFGMFRAALGLTGRHERWGMRAEATEQAWEDLSERARSFRGTTIMGHEVLAPGRQHVRDRVQRDLDGVELSAVVTARDLGRQLPAYWQERVKNESTRTFSDLLNEVTDDIERRRSPFWRGQDLGSVLRRWSTIVPPERIHVVMSPAPGAPPGLLWERFAEAIGFPSDIVTLKSGARNQSLGPTETALLRSVNEALGDRLQQPERNRIVKHYFAEKVLGSHSTGRSMTPAELAGPLADVTKTWIEQIRAEGYQVHGDLSELEPVCAPPGEPQPDDVDAESVADVAPEAIADLLVEVADLRKQKATAQRAARGRSTVAPQAPPPTRMSRARRHVRDLFRG